MPGELRDPRRVRIEAVPRHHVAEHRLAIQIGRQDRRVEDHHQRQHQRPAAQHDDACPFSYGGREASSSSAATIHRAQSASSRTVTERWKLAGDSASAGRWVKARNTGADASELPL